MSSFYKICFISFQEIFFNNMIQNYKKYQVKLLVYSYDIWKSFPHAAKGQLENKFHLNNFQINSLPPPPLLCCTVLCVFTEGCSFVGARQGFCSALGGRKTFSSDADDYKSGEIQRARRTLSRHYIYIFIYKGRLPPLLSLLLLLKFIVVRTAVRGAARRRK